MVPSDARAARLSNERTDLKVVLLLPLAFTAGSR